MPLYEFTCDQGHTFEKLVSDRNKQIEWCECGHPAERQSVYMIGFGIDLRTTHSEKLSTYRDTAREMEYLVSRSDDPGVVEAGTRIAHAAKVRAEAQMLAGHDTWRPDKVWNQKEPE